MPRNERDCRRPEFAGGTPITLGDGQEWTLPRPRLSLVPEVVEGRVRFADKMRHGFGPEYDDLVDAFVESEEGLPQMNALLALAANLLLANYDLNPASLVELLPRRLGDEANTEMWRTIRDLAIGIAPKPTPVG